MVIKFRYRQCLLTVLALASLVAVTNAAISDRYCGRDDCYEVLGVSKDASLQDIKQAFRKIAVKMHPDKVPDYEKDKATKEFQKVTQAYEILSDEHLRKSYDQYKATPDRGEAYHYYQYYKARYLPKTDPTLVVTIALLLFSGIQYMAKTNMNERAILMIERSDKFKRAVNDALSENPGKTKDEVRDMIRKQVVIQGGYSPPKLKDLAATKIVMLPYTIVMYAYNKIRWHYRYKVKHRPYLLEDKIYMTKKLLKISDDMWDYLTEEEREDFLEKELWVPARLKEYQQQQQEQMMAKREAFFQSTRGKKYLRYMKKNQ